MIARMEWNERMERRAVPWLLDIGIPGLLYIALSLSFMGAIMRAFPYLNRAICAAFGVQFMAYCSPLGRRLALDSGRSLFLLWGAEGTLMMTQHSHAASPCMQPLWDESNGRQKCRARRPSRCRQALTHRLGQTDTVVESLPVRGRYDGLSLRNRGLEATTYIYYLLPPQL
ncbi:hypothetical protein BJV78DRAFT_723108 [Lactifluus subvellereus]|nr:hypothetical protein BJV78DRAFT_723108 [Lactifluus subvellereus]